LYFALLLCGQIQDDWWEDMPDDIKACRDLSLEKTFKHFNWSSEKLFRFTHLLNKEINQQTWTASFLYQPKLFLRARPGQLMKVQEALQKAEVSFETEGNCLSLKNSVRVEDFIRLNKEAVIQDRSSQQVFDCIKSEKENSGKIFNVWDVCAASGGKSILLHDEWEGRIKLTVSDNRSSILHNLRRRMSEAGVPVFRTVQHDLTQSSPWTTDELFDLIICDVPCTGSGTWSRTPEQHAGFKEQELQSFQEKQLAIVRHALPHLAPGGTLIYITCSVFASENEAVCEKLTQTSTIKKIHQTYITGYEHGADTMFVAVFSR
jgi:16S rRNA (cytosine967-C5)-methyltransferase